MTTFAGPKATKLFTPIGGGHVAVAQGYVDVAIAPVVADIYQMCSIPRGAIVIDGKFWAQDIDTNATETLGLEVGWAGNGVEAASVAGLVPASVISGDTVLDVVPASRSIRNFDMSNGSLAFTNDTQIQVQVTAIAATFAAARMFVEVMYYIP